VQIIPYNTAMAAGVSMRLKAVQCLELVRVGESGAEDHGFAVVEGGFATTTDPVTAPTADESSNPVPQAEPNNAADF